MSFERLRVVTMVGPFDLIGELGDSNGDIAELRHPCQLRPQPQNGMTLRPMARDNPILTGDSLLINLRSVLWVGEPTNALRSAYQASRARLLVANGTQPIHLNA